MTCTNVLFIIIITFFGRNFSLQPSVCNAYNILQRAVSFNGAAIASVKAIDYRIHVWDGNKDETTNLLKNSDLNKKKWIIVNY